MYDWRDADDGAGQRTGGYKIEEVSEEDDETVAQLPQ